MKIKRIEHTIHKKNLTSIHVRQLQEYASYFLPLLVHMQPGHKLHSDMMVLMNVVVVDMEMMVVVGALY
jgi:hypothetical protein